MDEMREIAPEAVVIRIEAESRAEALLLHVHPDLADAVGRQLALTAGGMDVALELEEGGLADHRVQHVLDLGGQHDLAALRTRGIEQRAEGELLAEHRGRLGQGQRRDRKSTRLNSSHSCASRMPSSA